MAAGTTADAAAAALIGVVKKFPPPAATFGSNKYPTRAILGATSLRSPSHFPDSDGSALVKPVTLPPGRATLATNPSPPGSDTTAKPLGMQRGFFGSAPVAGVFRTKMISGPASTNSLA